MISRSNRYSVRIHIQGGKIVSSEDFSTENRARNAAMKKLSTIDPKSQYISVYDNASNKQLFLTGMS